MTPLASVKSIGHIGFTKSLEGNTMEVYESYDGDIYWASIHSYLECNGPNKGRRIGRFLCSAATKDSYLGQMEIQRDTARE